MAKIYYDSDADPGLISGKRIAVIGYGSQGHAHALNLKDSGLNVVVGLREGSPSWGEAEKAGLQVTTGKDAAAASDIVMILTPDEVQKEVYEKDIESGLKEGNALAFAHGFNIHFGQINPPDFVDVFMVAPKGPGHLVRRVFVDGQGTPCLVAVHQDFTGKAKEIALAYARGIGGTRAGVLETTFKEETETDLFGEQCVLCGGISELVRAGFDTLVEAGYQPELAYFECLHELKLIVDLMYEGGISWMRHSVSNTAEYGDVTRGRRLINEDTRRLMKEILTEIQSGKFAEEWIEENRKNLPLLSELRNRDSEHPVEVVGAKLRGMMSWLKKGN